MVRWLHPIAISMQTMGHVEHMPYSALPQKPLAPQHKSPGAMAAWEWGAVQAGGKWGCIQKRGLTQSDKRATGFSFLRQYPHLSSCWLLFICNMLTDNATINVDIKKSVKGFRSGYLDLLEFKWFYGNNIQSRKLGCTAWLAEVDVAAHSPFIKHVLWTTACSKLKMTMISVVGGEAGAPVVLGKREHWSDVFLGRSHNSLCAV